MLNLNLSIGRGSGRIKLPLYQRPLMPLGGMDEWSTPKVFCSLIAIRQSGMTSRIAEKFADQPYKLRNPPSG
ncbi:MAG: hypothetical protein CVV49_09495 [Spirochaetae bacterium HGW-Spirochaetae-5]|nr:MAG: hypothetical protein CVV49_09495 [Spirochaetae bacterium HGW-Spirochaetae-5]